jgi:hypothetical protein
MKGAFLAGGIVATAGLCLHVYTMEHWIYPKLKDSGFPATPFGDSTQMKKGYRLLWHFFTVNIATTAVLDFVFYFTDWFPNPTPVARVLCAEWFAQVFACFCVSHFSPTQLVKAFQWVILLAIGGLTWLGTV